MDESNPWTSLISTSLQVSVLSRGIVEASRVESKFDEQNQIKSVYDSTHRRPATVAGVRHSPWLSDAHHRRVCGGPGSRPSSRVMSG